MFPSVVFCVVTISCQEKGAAKGLKGPGIFSSPHPPRAYRAAASVDGAGESPQPHTAWVWGAAILRRENVGQVVERGLRSSMRKLLRDWPSEYLRICLRLHAVKIYLSRMSRICGLQALLQSGTFTS